MKELLKKRCCVFARPWSGVTLDLERLLRIFLADAAVMSQSYWRRT